MRSETRGLERLLRKGFRRRPGTGERLKFVRNLKDRLVTEEARLLAEASEADRQGREKATGFPDLLDGMDAGPGTEALEPMRRMPGKG